MSNRTLPGIHRVRRIRPGASAARRDRLQSVTVPRHVPAHVLTLPAPSQVAPPSVCYICKARFPPEQLTAHELECVSRWRAQNAIIAEQMVPLPLPQPQQQDQQQQESEQQRQEQEQGSEVQPPAAEGETAPAPSKGIDLEIRVLWVGILRPNVVPVDDLSRDQGQAGDRCAGSSEFGPSRSTSRVASVVDGGCCVCRDD